MLLSSLGRFAFLTLPNFSMIACANAIEVLRMANRLSGTEAFAWEIVTVGERSAAASNGLSLGPALALEAASRPDLLLACGGIDVRAAVDRRTIAALRRLARDGVALGGLCTGAFALAEAGLLRGRRCAIHWENLHAIEEEFPDIEFTDDLYVVDRDRITCTGGVAPLSMMLAVVEARLGSACSAAVAAQFMVDRVRPPTDRQRVLPGPGGQGRLGEAVRMMQQMVSTPLPMADVARGAGLSVRQMERMFQRELGQSPAAFAAGLRLDRARSMLGETAMPVTAVATACGYATPSRFSVAYRSRFGRTPSDERRDGGASLRRSNRHARQPHPT